MIRTKRLALCALLTALALVLSIAEKWIPLQLLIPVPGIKLGLANTVTLFALTTLPYRQTIAVLLCRIMLGSLFFGSVTGFVFALMGGILALVVMAILLRWQGRCFSFVGISVAGAAAHNIGQVLAAMLWLQSSAVFGYLPLLLLASIPMGVITGTICQTLLTHLKKLRLQHDFRIK